MPTRLMVALDYPTWAEAQALVTKLQGLPVIFKVGFELFVSEGPRSVESLKDQGFEVFLDLKLHDIPHTVASAVRAAGQLKVDYLTVHLGGGLEMLLAAKAACDGPGPKILGVSVLTSFSSEGWKGVIQAMTGVDCSVISSVEGLVRLGKQAGMDGIVSSGQDLAVVRRVYPRALTVVPGIRPLGTDAGDQARIMSPSEAAQNGAGAIVVGRPISRAQDPRLAAQNILAELAAVR